LHLSGVSGIAVNPLFVFKTRFQTAALKDNPNIRYGQLMRDMTQNEGIRGFFKGGLVAQYKNTQMVIQMPLYDYLANHTYNPLIGNGANAFVSGCVAKLISCSVYYPLDNIRTNIRRYVEPKSIAQVVKDIYARPGGMLNFYRGIRLYWLSAVPTFGLIMYSYETIKEMMD